MSEWTKVTAPQIGEGWAYTEWLRTGAGSAPISAKHHITPDGNDLSGACFQGDNLAHCFGDVVMRDGVEVCRRADLAEGWSSEAAQVSDNPIPPSTLAAADQSNPEWWMQCAEWHEEQAHFAFDLLPEVRKVYIDSHNAAALACRGIALMMTRGAEADRTLPSGWYVNRFGEPSVRLILAKWEADRAENAQLRADLAALVPLARVVDALDAVFAGVSSGEWVAAREVLARLEATNG